MKTFFTADTHYNHSRIIYYQNRPFSNVEEMNEAMIDNHNSVVGPKDNIYFLGDFIWADRPEDVEKILARLNGRKHLVFGDHDHKVARWSSRFVWKKDLAKIKVQGQKIVLCHYAMRTWNSSHYGSWQLFGHSHGKLPEFDDVLSFDVGVDAWNFMPVSFDQVRAKMATKNFVPIDQRD